MEYQPLYSLDDLYISPFDAERVYTGHNVWHWEALPERPVRTHVPVFDRFIEFLAKGNLRPEPFMAREGLGDPDTRKQHERRLKLHTRYDRMMKADFIGLVRLLTGYDIRVFCHLYALRRAEDLMRYTDLSLLEICKLTGYGCRKTFHEVSNAYWHETPADHRWRIRSKEDVGRYRLREKISVGT